MYDVTPQQSSNGLTVAEVFSGGGLMAVGLKTAGYELVWANDFEKTAVKAYKHNLGDHITLADITQVDPADIPDTDIIAGGPPCQDFSVAGSGAGEKGDKGRLVWTYLSIIEKKQPKAFIFENVKGLIQKKHRHTFDALLVEFERIGYTVSWKLINSWDYGVAQKRERVFIVGIRRDLEFTFEFPQPESGDVRTQVLRNVIGDLLEPVTDFYYVNRQSWKMKSRVQQVFGMEDVAPTLKAQNMPFPPGYEPSEKDAHVVKNHDPKPLSEHVQTKIENGGYDAYLKKHPIGNLNEPSITVTSNFAKGAPNGLVENHVQPKLTEAVYKHAKEKRLGYHPLYENPAFTIRTKGEEVTEFPKPRRFTVRECLRIQSVPDWYVIPDEVAVTSQYRIVGNGVASRVAWYLGKALAEQINLRESKIIIEEVAV